MAWLLSLNDELINWSFVGFVTWRGPCNEKPRSAESREARQFEDDKNGIKTRGSDAGSYFDGDERTCRHHHKHLVQDAGIGTCAHLLAFYVLNI